jgi:rubrerythrin
MTTRELPNEAPLLWEYIELAARLEIEVAELYNSIAEVFADDVEFANFWRLSAEAERYHAATILVHMHVFEARDLPTHPLLPVEMSSMRALLARLAEIRTQVASRPPTRREALEIALEIEENGAEVHGRSQFEWLYEDMRALFVSMAQEDLAHRRSFDAMLKRLPASA